jgi:glycosyltransferase involved in cell wall biosynthesis
MSNKTLIVCLHPYSNKGGATNKIAQLLNKIDQKEFEIVYIYLKKNSKLKLNTNIKSIKLRSQRTLFSILEIRKILSKFDRRNFKKKIFISNQNYSNVLVYFLLKYFKNFKSILIERNHLDELYYYKTIKDFFKKFIIKTLMKLTYRYSYKIIGNSKDLSKDLSKFVNKKVQTIYSPTNFKKLIQLSEDYKPKNILYEEHKIKLLSVSRFTKRKDLITLLKAFKIINSKHHNIELILIGYGPELNSIKQYIKKHNLKNNIFLISYKDNPYPYFLISDLYIMPSLYEGCPNSIIEATALNLPVISSNCNSGPSEILLNGKGGFIFEKRNYIKLADKIELFIKNKKIFLKKMSIAKKNIIRFDEKRILREYISILKRI